MRATLFWKQESEAQKTIIQKQRSELSGSRKKDKRIAAQKKIIDKQRAQLLGSRKKDKQIAANKKLIEKQQAQLSQSRKNVRDRDKSLNLFANTLERVAKQLRRNTTKGRTETEKMKEVPRALIKEWQKKRADEFVRGIVESLFPDAAAAAKKQTQKDQVPIPAPCVPMDQRL